MSRGETLFIKTAAIYRLPLFLPFNHLQKEPIFAKETICTYLINIFIGGPSWNRQHHGQTIHPTENLISMNLFKIFWL